MTTQPPRRNTGEQPTAPPEPMIYQPTPENVWLNVKTILAALTFVFAVGGVYAQGKAVAADVEEVKQKIEQKADAKDAKAREDRLARVEQILAVQTQINIEQAKLNEKVEKALDKNEQQHERILEKLDKALSKKP